MLLIKNLWSEKESKFMFSKAWYNLAIWKHKLIFGVKGNMKYTKPLREENSILVSDKTIS